MPRQKRQFLPGIPLHLIQRGHNRQPCFFAERDYRIYLSKLNEYRHKYNIAIHSYVLMTNHVHLLLTPADMQGPSLMLQALGRYYVRYINSTYGRTGTLWEGRFKASLIESDAYFLAVSRYVELNPVRAGMVPVPGAYPWSSYQTNAHGKANALLTPHELYKSLGSTRALRLRAYRRLFEQDVSERIVTAIRKAANCGWVLGNSRFKLAIEEQLGWRIPPFVRGGDRRSAQARSR